MAVLKYHDGTVWTEISNAGPTGARGPAGPAGAQGPTGPMPPNIMDETEADGKYVIKDAQWVQAGIATTDATGRVYITFPTPFPMRPSLVGTVVIGPGYLYCPNNNITATGGELYAKLYNNTPFVGNIHWIAVSPAGPA